ncbi:hypothetical protein [Francisella philomiragia]|uniref:hypothetical protein n=1 Tax=Francisella philomiragia TaxID=28110 RepID=UPI0019082AD6|nr:hypothetical protein [Francisella philomiragia]MBK2270212.1 hypothetical protein [Francisella philomiragia]MBK2275876.1 hypothetical protein [Francisella philomiragia]MBK2305089.1 hypothetical protein [Francisella philomiragia]
MWYEIYFLVITVIGTYYILKYGIKWLKEAIYEIRFEINRFLKIKRIKRAYIWKNVIHKTKTEYTIKNIVFSYDVIKNIMAVIIFTPIIFILPYIITYYIIKWFFIADHANSDWIWFVKNFWWSWYLVRGTIFFTFMGLAWKQLKQFPKIVYFKDLKFIFSRAFLMIYCLVLIFTIVEVIQDIAFGTVSTPLYMYYINWLHF